MQHTLWHFAATLWYNIIITLSWFQQIEEPPPEDPIEDSPPDPEVAPVEEEVPAVEPEPEDAPPEDAPVEVSLWGTPDTWTLYYQTYYGHNLRYP